MTEIPIEKKHLRTEIRRKRDNFVVQLPEGAKLLAFSVPPSPLTAFFRPGVIVAGYRATASEADPSRLLMAAHEAGCQLALPYVSSRSAPMRFLQWQPGEAFETGPFNLQQPLQTNRQAQPDIVLMPMLAFDRKCERLGQGAGHYDRALSLLPEAKKIGIAWSVQEVAEVPRDIWDIPLDAVLTEREWIVP